MYTTQQENTICLNCSCKSSDIFSACYLLKLNAKDDNFPKLHFFYRNRSLFLCFFPQPAGQYHLICVVSCISWFHILRGIGLQFALCFSVHSCMQAVCLCLISCRDTSTAGFTLSMCIQNMCLHFLVILF